jgi:hypothetical protein
VKPLFGRMRWIFGLAHNRSNELQRDEHTELCNAILEGQGRTWPTPWRIRTSSWAASLSCPVSPKRWNPEFLYR